MSLSLDELIELRDSAKQLQIQANSFAGGSEKLKKMRAHAECQDPIAFLKQILSMHYSWDELAKNAFLLAFAEAKDDIIRLAELRLESEARSLRNRARACEKQLSAALPAAETRATPEAI